MILVWGGGYVNVCDEGVSLRTGAFRGKGERWVGLTAFGFFGIYPWAFHPYRRIILLIIDQSFSDHRNPEPLLAPTKRQQNKHRIPPSCTLNQAERSLPFGKMQERGLDLVCLASVAPLWILDLALPCRDFSPVRAGATAQGLATRVVGDVLNSVAVRCDDGRCNVGNQCLRVLLGFTGQTYHLKAVAHGHYNCTCPKHGHAQYNPCCCDPVLPSSLAAVDHGVIQLSALDRVRFWLNRKTRLDDGRDTISYAVVDKHNALDIRGKAEGGHYCRRGLHAKTRGY